MSRMRLFDYERARQAPRSRCTALVLVTDHSCYACGDAVDVESIGQLALFRHGGYGATQMSTFHICRNRKCRSVRLANVIEVNPRVRA